MKYLLASTALSLLPAAALAQGADGAAAAGGAAAQAGQDHLHSEPADIVVTAPFVRNLDVLAGTQVLTGEALARDIRPQIGDTLTRLPGVSATSFSPGASRPVLRGFQGERVRVLTDGIGAIDASNTSADHAVTIDPITAERIEVLHGPAVLLFGSQAIGGAVNVFERRIPRAVPDETFHIDALATYGSTADERSIGAGVDVSLGGGVVLHVDGSYRRTDDLRVGGFVLSPELRAEQLEIAAEEAAEGHAEEAEEALELAGQRGRLPNSATETWTAGVGLAIIREGGSLGFSVSAFDSDYGVPLRPGMGHHHEEGGEEHEEEHEEGEEHGHEDVTIGLEQVRADLRGEIDLGEGFLQSLRIRLGAADYEHTEFEGDEVGTVFRTEGLEGRFELVQNDRGGWRGVTGAQLFVRDLEAVGAEAFLPPNQTSQVGVFTLQEVDLGALSIEGAARYERTDVEANTLGLSRSFDALSVAAGLSYEPRPGVRFGLNLSRSERAPAAEELYSDGPHIATQAYEIGDPNLSTERSLGGELFARAELRGVRLSGSAFYNRFDNYIYQAATGEEEDDLPVFQYLQEDATHWGFELGASATVARFGNWRLNLDGVADYVEVEIDDEGPAPRIPPLRLLGGIEAQGNSFGARLEVEHAFEQDRVSDFETPTEAFTFVNASVTWRPFGDDNATSLIFSANNIFDVEARRHASFTKDFVPLAGRDLRVTARVSF